MSNTYDFAVLGGGLFGLSVGWQLAKAGVSVAVIDRSPTGSEASGYALGRVDPPLTDTLDRPGMLSGDAEALRHADDFTRLAALSYAAHWRLRGEIEAASGVDYHFQEQPFVELLHDAQDRRVFEHFAPVWSRAGVDVQLLDPSEVSRLDSRVNPGSNGAAVIGGEFFVDSLKLCQALAACAEREGAAMCAAEIEGLRSSDGSVTVRTGEGDISAGGAVIALGPWTGEFTKRLGFPLPVTPSKGEILRLRPPQGQPPLEAHFHNPISVVQKRDGLIWAAATSARDGFNREPTQSAADRLRRGAAAIAPYLKNAEAARHTVCFRPETPDGMPILGALGDMDRVWVAGGGYSWGILYGLAIGEIAARMILNGDSEAEVPGVSPARFLR